jgi:hypothetical protein
VFRRLLISLAAVCATLVVAPAALAAGGNYVFDGGTAVQQRTVVSALDASSFPWDIVPGPVVVHIERGTASRALAGQIWLDADLLDAGRFSWGVVQHEYAHQVDFSVLTDSLREQLHQSLAGASWWAGAGHADLDCERFADLVAWSYWQAPDNVMKPQSAEDEGGQMTPEAFRTLLATLLPATAVAKPAAAVRTTAALVAPTVKKRTTTAFVKPHATKKK